MRALTFDNPWIRDVEVGRGARRPGVLVVIGSAAALAILLFVGAIAMPLSRAVGGAAIWTPAEVPIAINAVAVLVLFGLLLAAALAGGLWERRRLWRTPAGSALATLGGLVVGAAGFTACVGLAFLAGAITPGDTPAFSAGTAATLIGVAIVVFQASVEEIYFRGWLQPLCCWRLGPWLGLAATSVLFAALHIVGGARAPLAIFNLFLGGVMFGLLALRTGGLWAPVGAHFAWNWSESGLLGLDPNPGVGVTGSLFDLNLSGPTLWSGGRETMNASLAATIVLTVIVTVLAVLGPRTKTASRED